MTAQIEFEEGAAHFFETTPHPARAIAKMRQIDADPGTLWEREADRDRATPLRSATRQGDVEDIAWRGANLAVVMLAEDYGEVGTREHVKARAILRVKRRRLRILRGDDGYEIRESLR